MARVVVEAFNSSDGSYANSNEPIHLLVVQRQLYSTTRRGVLPEHNKGDTLMIRSVRDAHSTTVVPNRQSQCAVRLGSRLCNRIQASAPRGARPWV